MALSRSDDLRGWRPPDSLVHHLQTEAEVAGAPLTSARMAVQTVVDELGRDLDEALEGTDLMRDVLDLAHLPTLVVVALPGKGSDIELTYDLRSLDVRWILPWIARSSFCLDWRAYIGGGSIILDGHTTCEPRSRDWRHTGPLRFVIRNLERKAGFLVGFILRQVRSRKVTILPSDPAFRSRRTIMEAALYPLGQQVRDLDQCGVTAAENAAVFIHGTCSYGLVGLAQLAPFAKGPLPLFRYEHDTFIPASENGMALAKLIDDKVRTKSLTLIAHSRGGLVARFARSELKNRRYPAEIRILTFGTPHQGTPLVNALKNNASALFRLGRLCFAGIPKFTMLEYVLSSLFQLRGLPEGISIMEEGSEVLRAMNQFDARDGICAWGSKFDLDGPEIGYSIFLNELLDGLMNSVSHDLVVPTDSALGFGSPQPPLGCSHSTYFQQAGVRQAISQAVPGILL
jgi:hypothetical protein